MLKERLGGPPTSQRYSDCLIPPAKILSIGPLRLTGGVYRDRKLVPGSELQRGWGGKLHNLVSEVDELSSFDFSESYDEAVYGGYFFSHFGHFVIETTTRLWWVVENNYKGPVVFQMMGMKVPTFAEEFFGLLGIRPVFVRGKKGVRAGSLIVPDVSAVERGWVSRAFIAPFQRLAEMCEARNSAERIFVLRGEGVAPAVGEGTLQELLQEEGYVTVDPARISLRQQIAAFAGAREIVGLVGSAMHNIVYSRKARRVAYISRTNSISNTFPSIDSALNAFDSYYIYAQLNPLPLHGGLRGPYLIDTLSCQEYLKKSRFLARDREISAKSLVQERESYMREWTRIFEEKGGKITYQK